MTTTNLTLNVTINDGTQTTLAGVFADLSELASNYTGVHDGVFVSARAADDQTESEPSDEDLGRIAYDTHLGTLLAAEICPAPADEFDDLHPDYRNAWIQAALAARNA